MAKPKNNRPLSLQIPANREPQEIESRFLALYDVVDAKQSFLRELLFTGFLLRSFGVSQAIMDLERSGTLDTMDDSEKREAIARLILGSSASLSINRKTQTPAEKQQELPLKEANSFDRFGA